MGRRCSAIRDLRVAFATAAGERRPCAASTSTSRAGEIVAIVGESGSGKSQTCSPRWACCRRNGRATRLGAVRGRGTDRRAARRGSNRLRGSKVAMIFQEPMTALDPLYPLEAQIAAPLIAHARRGARARPARGLRLLEQVGDRRTARARARAYPHQLSGGERQRAMIAMAIANRPSS